MNVDRQRRWLMPAAWGTVALLVLSLALREGLAQWREHMQWQALAASAAQLQAGGGTRRRAVAAVGRGAPDRGARGTASRAAGWCRGG
ncbi:hypothetical protein [Pseudomonas brassicae]|uniref:hypothetical protein n=1 Tax=Pseudomonas brassicae TaxID=2708063 RepID=UPI003082F2F0